MNSKDLYDMRSTIDFNESETNFYANFILNQSTYLKSNMYKPKYLLIGEVPLKALSRVKFEVVVKFRTNSMVFGLTILESDQRFKCEVLS